MPGATHRTKRERGSVLAFSCYSAGSGRHAAERKRGDGMSVDRTVREFVREVDHVTGVRIRIGWIPLRGLYLEDVETGCRYALGGAGKTTVLTPSEQESICRGLHREHLLLPLGLDAPDDD